MKTVLLLTAFVWWQVYSVDISEVDVSCSKDYCKQNYIDLKKCDDYDQSCDTGKLYPSPTPCTCCQQCISYHKKGDVCDTYEIGLVPNKICGPGLQCITDSPGKQTGTCQRIRTPCTDKQYQYDEARADGTLGVLDVRPECDTDGSYNSYFCLPQSICYCVTKEGNRIFGDVSSDDYVEGMDCTCSRDWQSFSKLGLEGKPPRCLANGNYDKLQCSEEDNCICTDDPEGKIVSYDQVSTLPCYDSKIHNYMFYTKCELERNQSLVNMKEAEAENVILLGMDIPTCDLDGSYYRVQYQGDNAFCVDPDGKILESFIVPRGSDAGRQMNCNCARTNYLAGKEATGFSKPRCCTNGNYWPWQCNGDICVCVDSNGAVMNSTQDVRQMEQMDVIEDESLPVALAMYSEPSFSFFSPALDQELHCPANWGQECIGEEPASSCVQQIASSATSPGTLQAGPQRRKFGYQNGFNGLRI